MNKDFRQAINFAFDRTSYGAQGNGEDGATKVLRNTWYHLALFKLATRFWNSCWRKISQLWRPMARNWPLWRSRSLLQSGKAKAKFAEGSKQALQAKELNSRFLRYVVDQSSTIGVQWASSTKQSIESALGAEKCRHWPAKDEHRRS